MHVPKPVLALVATALGGFGVGVAFATSDDAPRPHVEAAPPSTPDETVDPRQPSQEEDGDERSDGGNADDQRVARYYGPECGAEIPGGTHGDYVSRTAHEGGDVPTMAHSNCGKPLTSVHDTTPAPETPSPDDGGGEDGKPDHPHGGPPGQTKDKGKPPKS